MEKTSWRALPSLLLQYMAMAVHPEGNIQGPFDPLGARERFAQAQMGPNAFCQPDEESVPRLVAQGVVDALEVVEVHVHQRHAACPYRLARERAWVRRSRKSARLGRPVRGSWKA